MVRASLWTALCVITSCVSAASPLKSASSIKSSTSTSSAINTKSSSKLTSTKTPSTTSKTGLSVTTPSGCPPITITTSTTTETAIADVFTSTVTYYTTTCSTVTQEFSTISTLTISRASTTVTSTTYSSTFTTVSVSPAKTTVTKPTSKGFTPVLCEPDYYNPTVTTTSTYTYTGADGTLVTVQDPSCTTTISDTSTSLVFLTVTTPGTFTTDASLVKTITSTRTDRTSTVYAACATNNITPNYPHGGYVSNVQSGFAQGQYLVQRMDVPAVDVTDCCNQCQATALCVGTAYYNASPPYNALCSLYTRSDGNQTCDPRYMGLRADESSSQSAFISNGQCGQYFFVPPSN